MNYKKLSQRIRDERDNPFKGFEGELKSIAGDFNVSFGYNSVQFSKDRLRWSMSYDLDIDKDGNNVYIFHYGSVPSYGNFTDDDDCKDLYALVGRAISSGISQKFKK